MAIGKHSTNDGSGLLVALLVIVVLAVLGATALSIRDHRTPIWPMANPYLPVK